MARTQMNRYGINNRNLTGASMISEMGIWDETLNYSVDQRVYWNTKVYKCISATTGTTEGVITGSPDTTPGNWTEVIASAPPNTFASCTNSTSQTANNTEVRIALANIVNTPQVTISSASDRATFNTTGTYRISFKINLKGATNQRVNPLYYFKINGSQLALSKTWSYNRNTADGHSTATFMMTRNFTAGDYIDCFFINNSNHNITVISNESYFEFEYIAVT